MWGVVAGWCPRACPIAFAVTASVETLLLGAVLALMIARRARLAAPLAVRASGMIAPPG